MNKTILKTALSALCLLGLQSITSSSQLMADEKIPLIRTEGSTGVPIPNRTPIIVPTVSINDGGTLLTFTSTTAITFSVEIEDENGNTMLTDVLSVQENDIATLSIASLPTGDYTLYVIIGDNTYEGEFSK